MKKLNFAIGGILSMLFACGGPPAVSETIREPALQVPAQERQVTGLPEARQAAPPSEARKTDTQTHTQAASNECSSKCNYGVCSGCTDFGDVTTCYIYNGCGGKYPTP